MSNFTLARFLSFLGAVLISSVLLSNSVRAAGTPPQLIISWHADTYTPPGYSGKALPTANSSISATVSLLVAGKFVDLSRETVYWYLENQFLRGGEGAQSVVFRAPSATLPPSTLALRVEIPSYKSGALLKSAYIPVVSPEAVLEAPFPNGKLQSGALLRGTPYFFNAQKPLELSFLWKVNGELPHNMEDPETLLLSLGNLPQGTPLHVELTIQNPLENFESGRSTVNLISP